MSHSSGISWNIKPLYNQNMYLLPQKKHIIRKKFSGGIIYGRVQGSGDEAGMKPVVFWSWVSSWAAGLSLCREHEALQGIQEAETKLEWRTAQGLRVHNCVHPNNKAVHGALSPNIPIWLLCYLKWLNHSIGSTIIMCVMFVYLHM